MIHFEGVEAYTSGPDAVYAKLSDAGFLAGCLPDTRVGLATADRAEWKVKPKLPFLSGELETVAVVTDRTAGQTVKYRLDTKGIGSGSVVEAVLTFTPDGTGTKVTWTGDITATTGLLKLAPKGLVQGAAQKVIADCWAAIRAKVDG
jgi:carbon monoxide dehydrogenase subunit G